MILKEEMTEARLLSSSFCEKNICPCVAHLRVTVFCFTHWDMILTFSPSLIIDLQNCKTRQILSYKFRYMCQFSASQDIFCIFQKNITRLSLKIPNTIITISQFQRQARHPHAQWQYICISKCVVISRVISPIGSRAWATC